MEVICPKCGKPGRFGNLGKPDHTGIMALIEHDFETMGTLIGTLSVATRRCFLTEVELTDEMKAIVKEAREWDRKPIEVTMGVLE